MAAFHGSCPASSGQLAYLGRRRNVPAELAREIEPFLDGILDVLDGFGGRFAVAHAAREVRDGRQKAPPSSLDSGETITAYSRLRISAPQLIKEMDQLLDIYRLDRSA